MNKEEYVKKFYNLNETKIKELDESYGDFELHHWEYMQLINYIYILQQENKQLKEQNKKEFADYTKFKQKQYDEYLEKTNKLIKERQHYKHIIDELEKWLKNHLKHTENIIGVGFKIDYESCYEIFNENQVYKVAYNSILNKLKELKGSDKE